MAGKRRFFQNEDEDLNPKRTRNEPIGRELVLHHGFFEPQIKLEPTGRELVLHHGEFEPQMPKLERFPSCRELILSGDFEPQIPKQARYPSGRELILSGDFEPRENKQPPREEEEEEEEELNDDRLDLIRQQAETKKLLDQTETRMERLEELLQEERKLFNGLTQSRDNLENMYVTRYLPGVSQARNTQRLKEQQAAQAAQVAAYNEPLAGVRRVIQRMTNLIKPSTSR